MSGVETLGGPQKPGTQRDGVLVDSPDVLDVEIKMDLLLLFPIRPAGRDMVRRELNTKAPLAVDDHAMEGVVLIDLTAQKPHPEGALRGDVDPSKTVICLRTFMIHPLVIARNDSLKTVPDELVPDCIAELRPRTGPLARSGGRTIDMPQRVRLVGRIARPGVD